MDRGQVVQLSVGSLVKFGVSRAETTMVLYRSELQAFSNHEFSLSVGGLPRRRSLVFPPVIRASRAVPMVSDMPPASSTTTKRLGAWMPCRAVSLYCAGAKPKATVSVWRFHSTIRQEPSRLCVAWRRRIWDHRMFLTCLNDVAVVTTCAVPTSWVITHHATRRAAKWDLPLAWQAGTDVLLLSRTETRISRCFDHKRSPRPCSTKPTGSSRHCAHGFAFTASSMTATAAFSSSDSLDRNCRLWGGVAVLRNLRRASRLSEFVKNVCDTLLQLVHRQVQFDGLPICACDFDAVVASVAVWVGAFEEPCGGLP